MSVTVEPYSSAGLAGCTCSDSIPTVNHVERRPSADRTVAAGTSVWSPAVSTSDSVCTRPEELSDVRASAAARIGTCSALASAAAVNGYGPQLWYGEIVSYGSGTETRYGSAVPQTSPELAVLPPELE